VRKGSPAARWPSGSATGPRGGVRRGHTLSCYDVSFAPGETKLVSATDPRLFPTKHHPRQLKLFALDKALVEGEWLKALGLEAYAPRSRERCETLQGALFSYLQAL
jgi:hypothetical protein